MVVDQVPVPRSYARGGDGFRRGAVLIASACCATSVAAAVVGSMFVVRRSADGAGSFELDDLLDPVLAILLTSIGALVVVRGRSNPYGWLLVWTGATLSIVQAAGQAAVFGWYEGDRDSLWLRAATAVQDQWLLFSAPAILLLPALFPDGQPVGRWRRPVFVASAAWVVLIALYAAAERPAGNHFEDVRDRPTNPLGVVPVSVDALDGAWLAVSFASLVIAVGSIRSRWRAADPHGRRQLVWVLFALMLAAACWILVMLGTLVVEVAGADLDVAWVESAALSLTWIGVSVALGIAILRRRLYDIDLVINRTLVYAAMSVLVVAVYLAIVALFTAVLPGVDDRAGVVVATGCVALAFAPVRRHVQGLIDRWMFGRRQDPYGVLTELGDALVRSGTPDTTLAMVVETVAAALKLPGVAIEVDVRGTWTTLRATGKVGVAGVDAEAVQLWYQGGAVGRMVATRRSPNEPLHDDDLRLLANVAHHAAGLVHAVRLNVDLQRSREAIVLAREEERRRLRRDLHDGLGPSLASQTLSLDAIVGLMESDPAAAAEEIRALKGQTRELVVEIRRLVHELRPPALDELGLVGALAAHGGQLARTTGLTIDIRSVPDPLADLPAAVELAAYRIGCEAITNVVRHADATTCRVDIAAADGELLISIVDDGVGVRAVTQPGVGMSSMRERAAELRGAVSIERKDAGGTVVTAVLPIAPDVAGARSDASPGVPNG